MGVEFGKLPARVRRVASYTLSAMEQRFWAKSVSHGLPNLFRQTMRAVPRMAPAVIFGVWIVKWSTAEHERSKRKNPKVYENYT